MSALLKYFIDLCLLRKGPQDLPASVFLLKLTVAVNLTAALLMSLNMQLDTAATLVQSLLEIALMLGLLRLVLNMSNHPERFVQSATAAMGGSALLSLLALPVVSLAGSGEGDVALLAGLAMLGLVIWSIMVLGHILRHALEIRLGQGAMLAVGYTFSVYALMGVLFPAAPGG